MVRRMVVMVTRVRLVAFGTTKTQRGPSPVSTVIVKHTLVVFPSLGLPALLRAKPLHPWYITRLRPV